MLRTYLTTRKPFCNNYNSILSWYSERSRNLLNQEHKSDRALQGVIGLEIHAQINAKTKLFSASAAKFASPPNTNVSHFDAAWPGTLPVLNRRCVEAAVRTALALQCKINLRSEFDRKHYFYSDMPAGYQITQQRNAIARNGLVDYCVYVRSKDKPATRHQARIHQIQLETDSGKSQHDEENQQSLIDLNRAGVGLLEIVTKPDFTCGEQAAGFVKEIQAILKLIDVCNSKMQEGSLRVDANISVHYPDEPLGVRTEVKNLNSIRSVQESIDYEILRQIELIRRGEDVLNETLSYNPQRKKTCPMRDKEILQDYRFMAEPCLPPLILTETEEQAGTHNVSIESQLTKLPESRTSILNTLLNRYSLPLENALTLMDHDLVTLFDDLYWITNADSSTLFNFLWDTVSFTCYNEKVTPHCLTGKLGGANSVVTAFQYVTQDKMTVESLQLIFKHILDGEIDNKNLEKIFKQHKYIKDTVKIEELLMLYLKTHPLNIPRTVKSKARRLMIENYVTSFRTSYNFTPDLNVTREVMKELDKRTRSV